MADIREHDLYPGYKFYSDGNIYSELSKKFIKLSKTQNCYTAGLMKLQEDGSRKRCTTRIHKILSELFVPNPENFKDVIHIDGDPFNNHVSNLK